MTYDFEIEPEERCRALIEQIATRFRIKNLKKIRLTCMCKQLKPKRTLQGSNIVDGSLVFLYVKGGKKGSKSQTSHRVPSEIQGRPVTASVERQAGDGYLDFDHSMSQSVNMNSEIMDPVNDNRSLALDGEKGSQLIDTTTISDAHLDVINPDFSAHDRSESCESDVSWRSEDPIMMEDNLEEEVQSKEPPNPLNRSKQSVIMQSNTMSSLSSPDSDMLPSPGLADVQPAQYKVMLNDSRVTFESMDHINPDCSLPQKKRYHRSDFETIAVIGRGAFGEVRVVVLKNTDGPYYAMKSIPKKKILESKWRANMRTERDLLAIENEWLVSLYLSFQDRKCLYLLMQFCAGGDFLSLLRTHHKLSEKTTVFYMAEVSLAINAVHEMGYVHRDLKPDNILLDQRGHVKLSDFGLAGSIKEGTDGLAHIRQVAKEVDVNKWVAPKTNAPSDMKHYQETRRQMLFSMVGTPDYMAPEVLRGKGYGKECDWWSLGVITFECLMGYPPFWSESKEETCKNIIQYTQTFRFPKKAPVSWTTKDFIFRLICIQKRRMGMDKVKRHRFFSAVDWVNIREQDAPIQPEIDEDDAGMNFDEIEVNDSDLNDRDSNKVSLDIGDQDQSDATDDHFKNWTMLNPVSQNFYKNNKLMYRRRSSRKVEDGPLIGMNVHE